MQKSGGFFSYLTGIFKDSTRLTTEDPVVDRISLLFEKSDLLFIEFSRKKVYNGTENNCQQLKEAFPCRIVM